MTSLVITGRARNCIASWLFSTLFLHDEVMDKDCESEPEIDEDLKRDVASLAEILEAAKTSRLIL